MEERVKRLGSALNLKCRVDVIFEKETQKARLGHGQSSLDTESTAVQEPIP